jgi:hypothetical protein
MYKHIFSFDYFKKQIGQGHRILIGLIMFGTQLPLLAQEQGTSKTIDITSSFKPSLIPPKKIIPNASPAAGTPGRPTLTYEVPAQQINFKYTPSALKPLAYNDTSTLDESRGYVKAGFGNFSTPYLKAAINYGDGENLSGNLEGFYTSSKGKLPFQQFAKYGIKTNLNYQLNENHSLQGRAGFSGQNLYRYGFQPDSLPFTKEDLKLNYNDIHLGATLGNRQANEYGIYYKAVLDAHFFGDNQKGSETALHYELPLEKVLNEKITMQVGVKGVLSSVKVPDSSFSNNLTMVKAGVKFQLNENTHIDAALLPAWNNGGFNLLPVVALESYFPEKDMVLQAGIVGSYIENTWRNLTNFNPWMQQPDQLIHSRNLEFFGAVKGSLTENWFFRIKGSYQRRFNVPLYVNDPIDGKTFLVSWEPSMNISGASGELVWQEGDKYSWSSQVIVQSFSGLKQSSKAYGMLPFEFNSTFRGKVADKLVAKVDFYHFSPTWRQKEGKAEKGEGGLDMNIGAEFDLMPKLKLWIQFNNLFNDTYQRWNQYPVLGFQALGGVILKL